MTLTQQCDVCRRIAFILAKTCDMETQAAILNYLVGVEADTRLSDDEVTLADALFDELANLRPDAVDVAMSI